MLAAVVGGVEQEIDLDGSPVFLRRAPVAGPTTPLYLHGAPMSADDWTPLLERTGGLAPDLPGFGRSGKGGQLDFSLAGQAEFLLALLARLDVGRCTVVAHDWSAGVALALAARAPEWVTKLVLVCPLGPGADPRRITRVLAIPGLGELALGAVSRRRMARWLARAGWPTETMERLWGQFDPGTQRALIRLARSGGALPEAPPAATVLVAAAADPWWPAPVADLWARRLPNAEREMLPDGRHWPWLESPAAAGRLAELIGR